MWFIFPNSTLNVFFLFSVQVAGLFAWFKGLQRKTALTFGVELHHRRRKHLYLLSTNATVKLFAALHPPLFLHLFLLFLFISSLSFSSSLLVTFGIFYFPPSCHVCCLPTLYSPSTEGLLCCRHVTHINQQPGISDSPTLAVHVSKMATSTSKVWRMTSLIWITWKKPGITSLLQNELDVVGVSSRARERWRSSSVTANTTGTQE